MTSLSLPLLMPGALLPPTGGQSRERHTPPGNVVLLPFCGSCNLTHATCGLESRTAMLCITRRYVESFEVLLAGTEGQLPERRRPRPGGRRGLPASGRMGTPQLR